MTDPDLPDERRLDDNAKARMRAELTDDAARSTQPRTPRRWLVPVLAAAAVAGVAALGAGVVFGGDDGDADRTNEVAPAGSGTANDPTAPPPSETPSEPEGSNEETLPPFHPDNTSMPEVSCSDEVDALWSGGGLGGQIDYAEGTAQVWFKGKRWVLCDDWAATTDGGQPTLIGNRASNDPADKKTYAISQNYSMNGDEAQFFAGGPALPGVKSISYTFLDGHTEDAVIKDRMWLMTYLPTSGPMLDPTLAEGPEPIRVEVTTASGTTSYDLSWAHDTCAQINHGC